MSDKDTVEVAAGTPDQMQPFAELGLTAGEYAKIKDILGRRPTAAELALYSVMWSEHCSYKSSKVHLKHLAPNEEQARKLLAGICSAEGNIVGLMPHPEHAIDPLTGPSADGLGFFTSIVGAFAGAGAAR